MRIRQVLDEFLQFRSPNAICAVDSKSTSYGSAMHDCLECSSHFLVIAFLSSLTILVLGACCIDAADHVVELRSSEDAVVFILNTQNIESRLQSLDQVRARSASVTTKDNLRRAFVNLANFINEGLIENGFIDTSELVIWSVCEYCSVLLP